MKRYPKPDWRSFVKNFAGMVFFLALIHVAPEIAAWIHGHLFGEKLVVDGRSYRAVLFVAYVMFGFASLTGIVGLAWGWWHNRKGDYDSN